MSSRDHIVLGIVYNETRDKALIARRPQGSHLGGLWEFPGGKVRDGEAALDALKRELYEEVNIEAGDCAPLISFDYDYPGRSLRFEVWKVLRWTGEVTGKEGQETRWANTCSLAPQDFPAANRGIIAACKLPPVYLITPDLDSYTPAFVSELRGYLAAGVGLVQFRSKTSNNHKPALMQVVDACRRRGAALIVNSSPEFAMEVGAAGVHLTSERLRQLSGRPLPAAYWVGASCHNMDELEHAVNTGVDFCVLSQVRKKGSATASKQAGAGSSKGRTGGRPLSFTENILGWDRFSEMVNQAPIPVYALGGMKLSDLGKAVQHGAQGIALVSDVWNSPDAAASLRAISRSPGGAQPRGKL